MKSPTVRLLAGLAFTLLIICGAAAYTLRSVTETREMQVSVSNRNRQAALQLIRIQSDLNSLGLAMRDMLDDSDQYPLTAWRAPLARIRQNLESALVREAELSAGSRPEDQTVFLKSSFADFWRTSEAVMASAESGATAQARVMIRNTLQPRQEALSSLTARLLVGNNEQEAIASEKVAQAYAQIERNAYLFLACSLGLILVNGLSLIRSNRKLFDQVSALARQRSELAQQLISSQESTFRAISRDLHDEFGQILTALGAMLRRAATHAPDSAFRAQVQETSEIVQQTLEKIRSLSQSLQPVILEEQGLIAAVEWYLAGFERHTGFVVRYTPPSGTVTLRSAKAIHFYRVLQEALNNVARHSGVKQAEVRLETIGTRLRLSVEDRGSGISAGARPGVGLAAMRERAELVGGKCTVSRGEQGGTRVEIEAEMDSPEAVEIKMEEIVGKLKA